MSEEGSGRTLAVALAVGIAAWVIASLSWLAWLYTFGGELGLFAVAAPFWAASVGYLPGAGVLLVYAVVQALRRRLSIAAGALALALYLLPALAAWGAFLLFLSLQPTSVSQGDEGMMMAAFAGPLLLLLYVIGSSVGFSGRTPRAAALRFLAVPGAGLVATAVFFAAYTVGTPHWQGRGDLALHVKRIAWHEPQGLVIEGELTVKRDLDVVMHAFYQDRTPRGGRGEPVQSLRIGEGRGLTPLALKAGTTYPVRMHWPSLDTNALHSARTVYLRVVNGASYHGGKVLREFALDVDPDAATLARLESRLEPQGPTGAIRYVTPSGKVAIAGPFDGGERFVEGRALVRLGERFGFIDERGDLVVPARYDYASSFSEGLAAVGERREGYPVMGYIDRQGAIAIDLQFRAAEPFSEGLARVALGGRVGYIDRTGRFVIAPQFAEAGDFHGGMAPVRQGERWGFIDARGEPLLEPQFEALRPARGRWEAMRDGRWGVVTREARWQPD